MKCYFAYGSNLNVDEMKLRCPGAVSICKCTLQDYHLAFRNGFLTIEPMKGMCVPCVIWQISDEDEQTLDRYEGYPEFYRKENITVEVTSGFVKPHGILITGMIYIMVDGFPLQKPSDSYFNTVLRGYNDFGISQRWLIKAYYEAKRSDDE